MTRKYNRYLDYESFKRGNKAVIRMNNRDEDGFKPVMDKACHHVGVYMTNRELDVLERLCKLHHQSKSGMMRLIFAESEFVSGLGEYFSEEE